MPNIISSPAYSIVDFNDPVTYCGDEAPFPLPAPAGVGFQVNVTDATASDGDVYWLGICDKNCNILKRTNITADVLCYRYEWGNVYGGAASWPTADKYPVLVNTCYGYDEFLGTTPYPFATETDLLEAISEALGVQITSFDDIEACCRLRSNLCLLIQDSYGTFYGNVLDEKVARLSFTSDTVDITPYVDNGNCFRYCVLYYEGEGATTNLACSQLFVRDDDDCYRMTVKYYGDDSQFDFVYSAGNYNLIRLPAYLRKPNFPIEEKIYKKSDGTYRRQFATVEKEWEAVTDYYPEWLHERIVIALKHDHVLITCTDADLVEKELTNIGGYNLDYVGKEEVYSPATFAMRQPVTGMNRSCTTSICCYPKAIAFEWIDEEAGTGNIYFGVNSNATSLQGRFKLNTDTEWTTADIPTTTSPLFFDNFPVSACDNTYYEVQMRTKCGNTYSAWSPVLIVRSPKYCGYPIVNSITGYGSGVTGGVQILLEENIVKRDYTYSIYQGMSLKASGTIDSNIITKAVLPDDTYTFTITSNCEASDCTITGTFVLERTGGIPQILSWSTTEV